VIGSPKSEAGHRTLPIPPAVVSELRAWKLRAPKGGLGLAFPNSKGGVQWHGNLLRRRFFPLLVRAGVCDPIIDADGQPKKGHDGALLMRARYALHSLRHAAASAWIRQGIDLKRLATWMGHSSIQVTIDTYGHMIADISGDAALVAAAQAELLA
jgi:integrase